MNFYLNIVFLSNKDEHEEAVAVLADLDDGNVLVIGNGDMQTMVPKKKKGQPKGT